MTGRNRLHLHMRTAGLLEDEVARTGAAQNPAAR
jgi:hypothetical protein